MSRSMIVFCIVISACLILYYIELRIAITSNSASIDPATRSVGLVQNIGNSEEEDERENGKIQAENIQTTILNTHHHHHHHQLLNLTDFTWLVNNETLCNNPSNEKILLVMVHSARSYADNRMSVRNTWGSGIPNPGWTMRLIFLMGRRNIALNSSQEEIEKVEEALEDEFSMFGDIVMGNFIDSYKNLSYKHLMGYKWVLDFCEDAQFVVKTDDDLFLDLAKFIDLREKDLEGSSSEPGPNLYCSVYDGGEPIRDESSKWFISEDEFPQEVFPLYCSGSAYGTVIDVIRKAFSVHQKARYMWIDDIFVTGAVMAKAQEEYEEEGFKIVHQDMMSHFNMFIGVYMKFCHTQLWNGVRTWDIIVLVRRNKDLDRNMKCLWKMTGMNRDGRKIEGEISLAD